MNKILITGASGFIGSFMVEDALNRGFDTWAGVRAHSSRKYLTDERIHFIDLAYSNKELLEIQLLECKEAFGGWDYIIHCAGVTKCIDKKDFDRVNYVQTYNLIETLRKIGMIPRCFLFASSLSVFGPIHENDYSPISNKDIPEPNTAYGISKLKVEQYLKGLSDFPHVIFRPTGVYGPREKDYFLMAKSIKQHFDFSVGYKRQDITFVYVKDLVHCFFLAIESGKVDGQAYFVTDGGVYDSSMFSKLIEQELSSSFVIKIKSPLFILKIISLFAEFFSGLFHKSSTLNMDKYKIMKQRNWQCDISDTCNDLKYTPQYNLQRGVKETIAWYKEEGWL